MRSAPKTWLAFDRAADGAYVLHAISEEGVLPLGVHHRIADAWAAVDAIDVATPVAGV